MKERLNHKTTDKLTIALFVIYLTAMAWILLLKLGLRFSYMENRSVNLIPFNEPSMLSGENVLNAVIFVPLGMYTGILFERWTFGKSLFFFFLLSSIIEGLQYIFCIGAFDVTDIVTNTFGGIVGWVLFKALVKGVNSNARAQKLVNLIAAAGTIVMIVLLVLLKMNMLPVRYQ